MLITTAARTTPEYTRKSEGDSIELADGRLLLAYMEFTGDGSDEAKTRIVATESSDGGKTWVKHRVLAETQPGDLNVYSPSLIHARDGSVLFFYMRQHGHHPRTCTQIIQRSRDQGATFEPYASFAPHTPFGVCNATVKRTASGRLLQPGCTYPTSAGTEYYEGALYHSDDDGLHWTRSPSLLVLPMRGVMEPHVEQAGDRLVMVMRTQLGAVFQSESRDDGHTWSKPQTSGMRSPESCPDVSRLPDGRLLLIWNDAPYDVKYASHYGKRTPLSAAVSEDNGRTWRKVGEIESDPSRAFSNPGCRFTRDGRAVVNYWTCEYLPNGCMQDVIDLRVAVIEPSWFR